MSPPPSTDVAATQGSGAPSSGRRAEELGMERIDAHVRLNKIRERMFGRREPLLVGRFELRSLLGRGAHGAVYVGWDRELERPVAVKLLNATAEGSAARKRLLREARTLARLKHPNVLAIHDVGVEGDRVFIAMEYAEAGTLAKWCIEHPPGTRARFDRVLELCLAVGRGLDAAHRAGIVHRDIKPANILLGEDGRPRIADFGLARAGMPADLETAASLPEEGSGGASVTLSRTVGVVGTPAYMAPEQFSGREDEASDQWSLCATLWEAAYGVRPFPGETAEALAEAVKGKPMPAPSERSEVPSWWAEILGRGLDADPARRWPSVGVLVQQLEVAGARRVRRTVATTAVVLGVCSVAAFGASALAEQRRLADCARRALAVQQMWNEGVAERFSAAMQGSGVAFAATSAAQSKAVFDAYVDRWRTEYAVACEAAEVEETTPAPQWETSAWCFEQRKQELGALVEVLSKDPDASAVRRAVPAASRLGRVESCRDPSWLERNVDAARDPAGAAIRSRLQVGYALQAAGRHEEGLSMMDELLADVQSVDDVRLAVRVGLLAAQFHEDAGAPARAQELASEAFDRALAAGENELAMQAATRLVYLVGGKLVQTEQAHWWARVASGLADALDHHEDLERARLHDSVGWVFDEEARYEDAEREHAAALAIKSNLLGDDHPEVASSLGNIATSLYRQGRYDEAERRHLQALEVRVRTLGPDHPDVANTHANIGVVYRVQGRLDDAAESHRRALEIRTKALGGEHPFTVSSIVNLGLVYSKMRRFGESEELLRRALAIQRRNAVPNDPDVPSTLNNLGTLFLSQQRYEEAGEMFGQAEEAFSAVYGPEHPNVLSARMNRGIVSFYEEDYVAAEEAFAAALAVAEKVLGPEHPNTAGVLNNLGGAYIGLERWAEADRAFTRSAEIRTQTFGPEHPDVGDAWLGAARARLRLDDPAAALEAAERALAIANREEVAAEDRAGAQFAVARALEGAGGDRERARALAQSALQLYTEAGADEVTDVQRWIARVGG